MNENLKVFGCLNKNIPTAYNPCLYKLSSAEEIYTQLNLFIKCSNI